MIVSPNFSTFLFWKFSKTLERLAYHMPPLPQLPTCGLHVNTALNNSLNAILKDTDFKKFSHMPLLHLKS